MDNNLFSFPPILSRKLVEILVWVFAPSRVAKSKKRVPNGHFGRKAAPSEGLVGTFLPRRCRLPPPKVRPKSVKKSTKNSVFRSILGSFQGVKPGCVMLIV